MTPTLHRVHPRTRLVAGLDLLGYDELATLVAALEGLAIVGAFAFAFWIGSVL